MRYPGPPYSTCFAALGLHHDGEQLNGGGGRRLVLWGCLGKAVLGSQAS